MYNSVHQTHKLLHNNCKRQSNNIFGDELYEIRCLINKNAAGRDVKCIFK